MKRTTVILSLLALTLAFFSCKEKEPQGGGEEQITVLNIDPTSISLYKGETSTITASWSPKKIKATPTFKSSKPEVATVDDKGVVTAVDAGRATIEVSVGKLKKDCSVVVSIKGQKPTILDNELPGFFFHVFQKKDGSLRNVFGNSLDETSQIFSYEKKMGRTEARGEKVGTMELTVFQNEKFGLIPIVAYGIWSDDMSIVMALVKETVKKSEETIAMLKRNGFSNAKVVEAKDGTPFISATHDKLKYIRVEGIDSELGKKYGAPMLLKFIESHLSDMYMHELTKEAKDLPSFEKLLTGDQNQIKEFEKGIGFREFVPDEEDHDNLFFKTIKDKTEQTNFSVAFYVLKPKEGSIFINSILLGVKGGKSLVSEETRSWMKLNGFPNVDLDKDGEPHMGWSQYPDGPILPGTKYYSADKKVVANLFMNYNKKEGLNYPMMQIFENKETANQSVKRLNVQMGNVIDFNNLPVDFKIQSFDHKNISLDLKQNLQSLQ